MRTITIEKTVYSFSELSESAKESAREWYRRDDDFECEFIYDDAATVGAMLGIDLCTKRVQLMNGKHRYDPCIFYSGFWSQGDGACFEGSYKYSKGAPDQIKSYAPKDSELLRIATELQKIQRRYFYQLTATMRHSGHYYHSGCMRVDVDYNRDDSRDISGADNDLTQCMRDFADWIYSRLESEYEYRNSDESIDSMILSNEYEFTENGAIV